MKLFWGISLEYLLNALRNGYYRYNFAVLCTIGSLGKKMAELSVTSRVCNVLSVDILV